MSDNIYYVNEKLGHGFVRPFAIFHPKKVFY